MMKGSFACANAFSFYWIHVGECVQKSIVFMTSILMPFMFASFRFQENGAIIPKWRKVQRFQSEH